jgi:hypothetical protein
LRLQDTRKLIKFDDVRKQVGEQHSLKNPDVVINMADIRVTPELGMEVPHLGTFVMTDWARKQLGSALGIQWDKWFNPKVVDHKVVQEEIQRRFAKTGDVRKIRTSRFRKEAPGVKNCDGYMRAVLGPTYHPIDDERIFDRLERQFGSQVSDLNFMHNHLHKKGGWGTDHSQHYTLVGDAIDLGPIKRDHSDAEVRRWYEIAHMEGKLPENDFVYPGFHIRNSEVGYTAITIDEFSFRLVCLNGLMITTGDSRMMYRQHRPIEDVELDRQLKEVFEHAPVRWEDTRRDLVAAQAREIENPAEFIEIELKKLDVPKHFRDAVVKTFENQEPLKTVYGVIQAITRTAQAYDDMDQRFEFEALGGRILQKHAH